MASIRDKVVIGDLDAAICWRDSIASTLGLRRACSMITAFSLGLNGNAITV